MTTKFQKGRAKTGGRKAGAGKLKSFRKALADIKFDVALEMRDLFRKTKDEMLKMELLKLMLEYSQTKPTTDLDEEGADVTNISEAALLAIASGDTIIPAEPDDSANDSDSDAVRAGESDAAFALDSAEDDSAMGSGEDN